MTYTKVHLDRCIEVAGDARAGVLLYHIMRWMKSTKVVRDGHRWATSTREQWAEQTGTSLKKVKTDLDKLSARGLLVREKHMFDNKSVLFLRPTDSCLLALLTPAGWIASVQNGTDQSYPIGTDQSGQNGTDLYKLNSETQTETQKLADGFAAANPETICLIEKKSYHGEVGNVIAFPVIGQGGPDMTTGAEIAAKFAAAKPKPIDTLKPDKAASLAAVWQQGLSARKLPVPSVFTKKEFGQFKRLIKLWDEGMAPAILQFVMANWLDFTESTEINAGAFKTPLHPQIDFLVKFQHLALTLFLKSKLKPAPKKPVSPPAKSVQPVAPPKPKEKLVTIEDVMAKEASGG